MVAVSEASPLIRCRLRGLRDIRLYLALALTGLAFALTCPLCSSTGTRPWWACGSIPRLYSRTGKVHRQQRQWYLAYLYREGEPLALLALAGILHGPAPAPTRCPSSVAGLAAAYGVFLAGFVTSWTDCCCRQAHCVCLSAWWLVHAYDQAIGSFSKPRQQMIGKLILTLGCLALLEVPLSQALRADLTLHTDDGRITGFPGSKPTCHRGGRLPWNPYTF